MSCPHSTTLGAYLLGALDPAERSEFDMHLARCEICRAELVRLAPLPGLLQRLTPDEFDQIMADDLPPAPPMPMPPAAEVVAMPVRAEPAAEEKPRKWRRGRLLSVAAAVVLVFAVCGVVLHQVLDRETRTPAPPPAAAPVTWSATDPQTGVKAQLELTARPWGTEVRLSMQDIPYGKKLCHFVVRGKDGRAEESGRWSASYRAVAEVPGSTSVRLPDIDRVEVIAGDGVLIGLRPPPN